MFHIVTPFPELLNYAFYAPIILRIALGFSSLLLSSSTKKEPAPQQFGVNFYIRAVLIIAGLMIIVGLYTQIAAIVLTIIFVAHILNPNLVTIENTSRKELILLIVISLTLILLGAGAYAIDYPL